MKVTKGQESVTLPERVVTVSVVVWMNGTLAARMMTGVSRHAILRYREMEKLGALKDMPLTDIYFSSDPEDKKIVEFYPPFPCDGEVEIVAHVTKRY